MLIRDFTVPCQYSVVSIQYRGKFVCLFFSDGGGEAALKSKKFRLDSTWLL